MALLLLHGVLPMARGPSIYPSPEEARQLQGIVLARSAPQAAVFRARIILRCAQPDDPTDLQVTAELV